MRGVNEFDADVFLGIVWDLMNSIGLGLREIKYSASVVAECIFFALVEVMQVIDLLVTLLYELQKTKLIQTLLPVSVFLRGYLEPKCDKKP